MTSKKRILGIKIIVLLVVFLFLLQPFLYDINTKGWKPDQHAGMGDLVLKDLEDGKVIINGVEYEVNSQVRDAILAWPEYYKMGCIGPDGFPDMIFGQVVLHPGFGTPESSQSLAFSYEWFDYMLTSAYSKNFTLNIPGFSSEYITQKAIAFTYGFMSHAMGDMFCHTFINRYSGGVWSLPTNGLRHMAIESYIDKQTGWRHTDVITPEEFNKFKDDIPFQTWIYTTFITDSWAREHTNGWWMENFYEMFFGLRDALQGFVDKYGGGWREVVGSIVTLGVYSAVVQYAKNWIDDIDDGLSAWIQLTPELAYQMFVLGDIDKTLELFRGWFLTNFLSMIGFPDGVGTTIEGIVELEEWIEDKLENIPGVGAAFKWCHDKFEKLDEKIDDYFFELAFGIKLSELKDFLNKPSDHLDDELLFGTDYPDGTPKAPYYPNTKETIDAELAFALESGTFNPEAFDVTYNTLTMSKLMLLDGAQLNELLMDNGVKSLYPDYSGGTMWVPGQSIARGFIKNLDADHQWMTVAPDKKSYGTGMPLWDEPNAREWVFKKMFHLGSQVWVDPMQQSVHTGDMAEFNITIVNTENQRDTIDIKVTTEGNGTFYHDDIPEYIELGPSESKKYLVKFQYTGNNEVDGGRFNISVTPREASTREIPEITSNYESATIIAFKGDIEYLWLTIGTPKYIKYSTFFKLPELSPKPPFNPIVPVARNIVQLWPRSPFEDTTYINGKTPMWIYSVGEPGYPIYNFSCSFSNRTWYKEVLNHPGFGTDRWGRTLYNRFQYTDILKAIYENFVYRTSKFSLNTNYVNNKYAEKVGAFYRIWTQGIFDGEYTVTYWYINQSGSGYNISDWDNVVLDNTPPKVTLTASNYKTLQSSNTQFYDNTTFTLQSTDLSGVQSVYYSVREAEPRTNITIMNGVENVKEYYLEMMPWTLYTQPFNLSLPTGLYKFSFQTIDKLGNIGTQTYSTIYYMDKTPPTTDISIGEPKNHDNVTLVDVFINNETPLSFKATDIDITGTSEPINQTYYRIKNETYNSSWQTYTKPIKLEGYNDGNYEVNYYSTDLTGNSELFKTVELLLDNTGPLTTLDISNPKYGLNNQWVNSSTRFTINAIDKYLDTSARYYRIWYNGEWTPWEFSNYFTLSGDGTHYVEYYGLDNLGNAGEIHNQTHYVNDTPPYITIDVPSQWVLEEGSEKTYKVTVNCYNHSVQNLQLQLNILKSSNLTIEPITQNLNLTPGESKDILVKVKSPTLEANQTQTNSTIKLKIVGDYGVYSNTEQIDIIVNEKKPGPTPGFELIITIFALINVLALLMLGKRKPKKQN